MALFNFVPTSAAPFQFQPTFDRLVYICTVTWNFAARRWYVNCFSTEGVRIFTLPLIGSPTGIPVHNITWARGTVTVETIAEHGYRIAETIDLVVRGCVPVAYNGHVRALITGKTTFTYSLADNPGPQTALGIVSYDISMTGGYFDTTLVYRTANRQFEVFDR